jgi:NAD(P)-dependent dehydrogenase (short-subunit alcohol dehydrogenase family)
MTWTARDIPGQHGRIAVVTGANSGLGLATTRALALKGARVVMATRNQERAAEARRLVESDVPGADLDLRELDLASLESVRACADGIAADYGGIDLLINNAGLMGIPRAITDDGFEMQLGVNHLGPFVLTRRLLPALLRSPGARVVGVTSYARFLVRPYDLSNPHLHGAYDPWRAYGGSKLANVHFALELQRRLEAAGADVASLVVSPGTTHTDLQARSVRETGGGLSQRFWHFFARTAGMSPEAGARAQLRAATDPSARGGEFYAPRWGSFGAPVRRPLAPRSRNAESARRLWELSERETQETFDVAALVAGAQ